MQASPITIQPVSPSRGEIGKVQAPQSEQVAQSDRSLTAGSEDTIFSNSFEETFAQSTQQLADTATPELEGHAAEENDLTNGSEGEGTPVETTATNPPQQLKGKTALEKTEPALNAAGTAAVQTNRDGHPAEQDLLQSQVAVSTISNSSEAKSTQGSGLQHAMAAVQQLSALPGTAATQIGNIPAKVLESMQLAEPGTTGAAGQFFDRQIQATVQNEAKRSAVLPTDTSGLKSASLHLQTLQAPGASTHPPATGTPVIVHSASPAAPIKTTPSLDNGNGQKTTRADATNTPNKAPDLVKPPQVQATSSGTTAGRIEAASRQTAVSNRVIANHLTQDSKIVLRPSAQTVNAEIPVERTSLTDAPRANVTPQDVIKPVHLGTGQAPKASVLSAPNLAFIRTTSEIHAYTGTTSKEALDVGEALFTTSRSEGAIPQTTTTQALARAELPPQTLRQISEILTQMPSRPVEITLSPEELGRLRMTVRVSEGAVAINMVAERPETLELLRRHIDHLNEEFRDLGFEDITFSFAGEGGSAPDSDTEDTVTLNLSDNDTADINPDLQPHPQIQTPAQLSAGLDLRL